MTADELLALPADGRCRELVAGELHMMLPEGGRHGRIALRLARRLGDFIEEHSLGETYAAETGFLIQQDPDTVRAPDVAFVSHARLQGRENEPGYLPLAPDLVAEVISPHDRASQVEEKVRDWLEAGVQSVLVVDPQTQTVRHYRAADRPQVHTAGVIDLQHVLVGFQLDVADLFA